MAPQRRGRRKRPSGDEDDLVPRSVVLAQEHTTVFRGAPPVIGPAAVLLGNIDNDPQGEIEIAVGGIDGRLTIFKGGHSTGAPLLVASGLGSVSALGLGPLLPGYGNSCQLVACSLEGVCHIFDMRWDGSFKAHESRKGRTQPLWSLPCPRNVSACCIADVNGDHRQEVVVGTLDGGVYVLSLDVDSEREGGDHLGGGRHGDLRRNRDHDEAGRAMPSQLTAAEVNSAVYSSSSADHSRDSTSPAAGDADDQAGPWSVNDDDSLAARPENSVDEGGPSGDPPAGQADLRRSLATLESDVKGQAGGQAPAVEGAPIMRGAWHGNPPNPLDRVDLSLRLKTLLKLRARGAVNSLATISCPLTSHRARNSRRAFGDEGTANSGEGSRGLAERGSLEIGVEDGLVRVGANSGVAAGGARGGSRLEGGEDEEAAGASSIGGVYVALGLRNETTQVMRLSCWVEGTDRLELIDPVPREETNGGAFGDGDLSESGGVGYSGDTDTPDSPEEHLHGETLARETENSFDAVGGDDCEGDGDDSRHSPGLDASPLEIKVPDTGEGEKFSGSWLGRSRGGRRGRVGGGDGGYQRRVPAEVHGGLPLSLNGWAGKGLVVPLAPVPLSFSGCLSVSPSPSTTPVPDARSGLGNPPSFGGWGTVGEGGVAVRGRSSSGAWGRSSPREESESLSAREGGGDDGGSQAFGICSSDGRVCCCRIVSSTGAQPRWQTVWVRQTEETMFGFGRLDYPDGPDRPASSSQPKEGKETLLVACALSGTTFLFDAQGAACVTFDPGEYLRQPITAFTAGEVTTGLGTTEPALVYLSAGGDVTVFHGLYEQAGPVAPPHFLQSIRSNGSLKALEVLLVALRDRLERRLNQGSLLFPANSSGEEGSAAGAPREGGDGLGADNGGDDPDASTSKGADVQSPEGGLAGLRSRLVERSQHRGALVTHDELLARAVLCPAAALKALPETVKEGSGVGGRRRGTGRSPGERWRREARAIARGEASGATVAEGLSAVKRVLHEMEAFKAQPRDRTLRRFPCLRGTLEALLLLGSGSRWESLRVAL